jgi:hypothetical protein
MSKSIRRGALFSVLVATVAVWGSSACTVGSKDTFTLHAGTRANAGTFRSAGVTTVFEKRCGSLDCHGSNARNLRIYSSGGLRLPNEGGLAPGQGATTIDESTANYQSIVNLEPEQTNEVIVNKADPHTLLVLKKPLELEHHKGGPAITRGDDSETCIVSWFTATGSDQVDKTACANAANFPTQ